MIPRYSPADMAALFTDAARFGLWLEVELLATEAQAAVGVVPAEDAATCRAQAPTVDDAFVTAVYRKHLARVLTYRALERAVKGGADRRAAA